MNERAHHRPSLPGARAFEGIEGGVDPAAVGEAADRSAHALVRGPRDADDAALVERVVRLVDEEGIETLAEVWSGAPADSLAGSLWRLFLLRAWVYADPVGAARQFDAGRARARVAEAVSGVEEPPGPEQVRALVDAVLCGVVRGDYADTLFRAAAFARVVAAGRAHEEPASYPDDLSASRLLGLADQLDHAGRLELAGTLA